MAATVDQISPAAPGETIEVSVDLVAPEEQGQYRGNWQLCANEDECFGQEFYVQIIASPPPTPTPTNTLAPTSTPIPDTAGVTDWLVHEGRRVGVREISWSYSIDYYRPESGKIFLSLYVLAVNTGEYEESFFPSDIALVDGGGEVHGELLLGEKEPAFHSCTIKPGGVCEGWWTTSIWDREETKKNLMFRWDPGWFISSQETEIDLE